jgi:hypothetical protein
LEAHALAKLRPLLAHAYALLFDEWAVLTLANTWVTIGAGVPRSALKRSPEILP